MTTSKPAKLFHCTYLLCYHFVFVTQGRRHCLTDDMIERLRVIIQGIAADYGGLLELSGKPDSIQFQVHLNPSSAPSKLANTFKTVSSRLLRRDFPGHFERVNRNPAVWSRDYFVASTGRVQQSVIDQYIAGLEKAEYVSE